MLRNLLGFAGGDTDEEEVNSGDVNGVESTSNPNGSSQQYRQTAIRLVAKDDTLDISQRTNIIQKLYGHQFSESDDIDEVIRCFKQQVLLPSAGDPPATASSSLASCNSEESTPTVQDEPCTHYKRHCLIQAKCCGNFFGCRLCHDDRSTHTINRFETENMKCVHCNLVQPVSDKCGNNDCSNPWEATYYCGVCKYWSQDTNPLFFHCEGCGICRVGKREDYDHCNSCSMCIPTGTTHKCLNQTADNNCPVCFEYMRTSRENVEFLLCGHAIHSKCFKRFTNQTSQDVLILKCPLCKKTAVSQEQMSEFLKLQIESTPMPEEYANKGVEILCNDCGTHSQCRFHFFGHQCLSCQSFNTVIAKNLENFVVNEDVSGEESQHSDDDVNDVESGHSVDVEDEESQHSVAVNHVESQHSVDVEDEESQHSDDEYQQR